MIYHRCKCGKREAWESGMPPRECQGCEECGTSLATGPDGHKPLIPHDWEPRYDERTGLQNRRICRRCLKMEKVK